MIGWKFFGRPIELVVLLFLVNPADFKCPEDDYVVNCVGYGIADFPITQDINARAILLRGAGVNVVSKQMVENYVKLELLDLGLQTTTLRLRGPVFQRSGKLKALKLDGNTLAGLSEDSFVGLRALQVLYLNATNVKDFINTPLFNDLSNLLLLNLERNRLTELPRTMFGGLANLEELNLNHNKFSTIPLLANLVELHTLELKGNDITQIDENSFEGLSRLQNLILDDNPITDIEDGAFQELTALRRLSLKNSKLTTIPSFIFNVLPHLASFDMSYSLIQIIARHDFANLPNIEHIIIANCRNLRKIESAAFSNLHKLQTLSLSGNQHLSSVDPDWLNNVLLTVLDVSGCALKTLPQSGLAPNRLELYASDNEWACSCENRWIASLCRYLQKGGTDCGARCATPVTLHNRHLGDVIADDCKPIKTGIKPGANRTLYLVLIVAIPIVIVVFLAVLAYVMRNRLHVCCGKARGSCLCKRTSFQSKQPLVNVGHWKRDRNSSTVSQTIDPYSGEPPAFKVLAEYPVPITEL